MYCYERYRKTSYDKARSSFDTKGAGNVFKPKGKGRVRTALAFAAPG